MVVYGSRDHAGGNEKMRLLVPGIKVYGGSMDNVKGCTDQVENGTKLSVGKEIEILCLHTPWYALLPSCLEHSSHVLIDCLIWLVWFFFSGSHKKSNLLCIRTLNCVPMGIHSNKSCDSTTTSQILLGLLIVMALSFCMFVLWIINFVIFLIWWSIPFLFFHQSYKRSY